MGKVKELLVKLEADGVIEWSDTHACYMKEKDGEMLPFDMGKYLVSLDYPEKEKHLKRHKELHNSLDELFADFVQHGKGGTANTIIELIEWSHKQSIEPDHKY